MYIHTDMRLGCPLVMDVGVVQWEWDTSSHTKSEKYARCREGDKYGL